MELAEVLVGAGLVEGHLVGVAVGDVRRVEQRVTVLGDRVGGAVEVGPGDRGSGRDGDHVGAEREPLDLDGAGLRRPASASRCSTAPPRRRRAGPRPGRRRRALVYGVRACSAYGAAGAPG